MFFRPGFLIEPRGRPRQTAERRWLIMSTKLSKYNQKRRFDKTTEPRGEGSPKPSKRLKFVVQHHVASHDHYDFRLEWEGVLKSWAVPKGPSYDSHDKRLAVEVEDHPFEYRNFEGAIPKGEYGGGTVMIWDEGDWLPRVDVDEGLRQGSLKFTLDGLRLKGDWALVRMKPREGERNNNWLLIKERDKYENSADIKRMVTSIRTGRSMAEIEEGKTMRATEEKTQPGQAAKRNPPLSAFKITNPDKVLYKKSGQTKGDIAEYYHKISKRMMPHLENRIISLVRCPGGIEKSCFYKKHPDKENRGLAAITVPSSEGQPEEYYYVEDIYGLMYEVQMNTLEFHVWGSRVETLEQPDVMVFDLDPDEGLDLEKIRQGVKDLKSLLDDLSMKSYLKTSGGKGYHVVIPFMPGAGWDTFHKFAQNIAKTMEAKWPDRYTSNVRKNSRRNRIFVDWLRNGRGATSVAPYSVRAREGAPVSMPITWKELDTIAPHDISMEEAVARLRRKDPWAGFFDQNQRLK